MAFSTCVFEVDQNWGGDEEGGWWYPCGFPSDDHANLLRMFETEDEAYDYANSIKEAVLALNVTEGRRHPSSVLCNGWLEVRVEEGYPKPFPDETPHYE